MGDRTYHDFADSFHADEEADKDVRMYIGLRMKLFIFEEHKRSNTVFLHHASKRKRKRLNPKCNYKLLEIGSI